MATARILTDDDSAGEQFNQGDVNFMDRVLEAWAIDAHEQATQLGYPEAGNIWGIVRPVENRKILQLEGKELMLVDAKVVALPWRSLTMKCRKLVFTEYFSHDPQGVKAQRFAVSVRTYYRRLNELQQKLYDDLQPDIQRWRDRVL